MDKISFLLFLAFWLQIFNGGFADEWKRVYLATYPCSGNHWTRFLLEEATNIATSSVYRDFDPGRVHPHLPTPFPWGGYCCKNGYEGKRRYPETSDIVVIKTHFPAVAKNRFDLATHLKTIRLIRHPVDTCYSNYAMGNKNPDKFIPHEYVVKFIEKWRRFHEFYNQAPNVVTFFYEDLLNHPLAIFTEMINEIGYEVQFHDIERSIARYPPKGYLLKHIDKFRREDLILIAHELGDLMEIYGYSIPIDTF